VRVYVKKSICVWEIASLFAMQVEELLYCLIFHSFLIQDLIAYKVKSQSPFQVEECSVGTGAACGAVYLDQNFEKLIRDRFGDKADAVLTDRRLKDMVRNFDMQIKRVFNPFDARCDSEFELPVTGVSDMPEINLEDGYLTLTRFGLNFTLQRIGGLIRC
jgi:hypothetical protein